MHKNTLPFIQICTQVYTEPSFDHDNYLIRTETRTKPSFDHDNSLLQKWLVKQRTAITSAKGAHINRAMPCYVCHAMYTMLYMPCCLCCAILSCTMIWGFSMQWTDASKQRNVFCSGFMCLAWYESPANKLQQHSPCGGTVGGPRGFSTKLSAQKLACAQPIYWADYQDCRWQSQCTLWQLYYWPARSRDLCWLFPMNTY